MSLKSKFSSAITLGFALGAFAVVGSAQDAAKTQVDKGQKIEREHGRGGRRGMRGGNGRHAFGGMRGGFGLLRGIELTEAQREQIRQIREANKPSEAQMAEFKAMREAIKGGGEITAEQRAKVKAYRDEMRSKHEAVQAQILGILTPEQRQQVEARKAEREKRRDEMRETRKQRRSLRNSAKSTDNN